MQPVTILAAARISRSSSSTFVLGVAGSQPLRAVQLYAGPSVSQEAPDPRVEAGRDPQFCQADSQEPVVHLVVRASEVVGDQHELLGRLAVRRLLPPGRKTRRLLPVILHLLDEPGESILHSAILSEADLLWWDELAGCSAVGQPSSDHAFGELGDVGNQGDGAVAPSASDPCPPWGWGGW